MKMYFVVNARMPNAKAYGIQMAQMCEAFVDAGVDLVVVLPSADTEKRSFKEFYNLHVDIPVVRLPTILLRRYERLGYLCMSLSFTAAYLVYFLWKKLRGEKFVLYTIDTDRYSSSALALIGAPLYTEMHGAKPRAFGSTLLMRGVAGVIAINNIIVNELKNTFPRSRARYAVEPNGVDTDLFSPGDKHAARQRLNLPDQSPTVLYAGRFFDWKGLEIIPRAAAATPDVRWQIVGGTREEFEALVKEPLPSNIYFAGSRPHDEMPRWIAAADAVLVLGTARDEQSYRWTSPMKLFEYLAANRPVLAADTPALQEIVSPQEAFFYKPDDAGDLAKQVRYTLSHPEAAASRVAAGQTYIRGRSWQARARAILTFIRQTEHTL